MISLTPRPKAAWHTIQLGGPDWLEVEITPPTIDALIADRTADALADVVANRLSCVTNWRNVIEPTADGGQIAVLFTRETLSELIRAYAPALNALLAALKPLFEPVSGEREKNSAPPPAAAATTRPLNDSACFAALPNSLPRPD